MKKVRIGINGFGRIGRVTLRQALERNDVEVVAINDLGDLPTMRHLFKYDSVHGIFKGEVEAQQNILIVHNKKINYYSFKNPSEIPWGEDGVDIVLECSGIFLEKKFAEEHIKAGAKRVLFSAPAKDNTKTIVLGVNDHIMSKEDKILSNASCTTNCAAPMLKVLEQFGIESAFVTTVHSYTNDQRIHDAWHKDLRRARAAAMSIIPTSTGAAKALAKIFPHLEGKLGGCGMRVPVPDGSLTDITCVLKNVPTTQEINAAFKEASQTYLKGILSYTEDPVVGVDIIGNTSSVLYDAEFTSIVDKMVKVIGWYDNEMGYSARLLDVCVKWKNL
ncbi:MAG: type I glyceraldehyde-3-phosphate dehydrogenase [Bacteroidia bacterium]|nr:type I glyceraldehyde-3-phosphate dehydrogenase [Bacteroidia bacterium]